MNAVKHGLTAKYIVIAEEYRADFEALRADLEAEMQPTTRLQHELIDRLAGLLWRLRRVALLEAALEARQVDARTELESQFLEAINQEARRPFEASYENHHDAIYRATMDGTYAARIGKIREEVKAEWNEADGARAKSENRRNRTEKCPSGTLRMLAHLISSAGMKPV
jgi:hypothetical protein